MTHHGDTEARSKLLHEELTEKIIGAAIWFNFNFHVATLVRGGIVRKVI